MKILIIEDTAKERDAALEQLQGKNELTFACSFAEARNVLSERQQFDVVLTDLMMPFTQDPDRWGYKEPLQPYGLALALVALGIGIKRVAVVSMANHHDHLLLTAIDLLSGHPVNNRVLDGDQRLLVYSDTNPGRGPCPVVTEPPNPSPGEVRKILSKDWHAVLDQLVA